VTPADVMARLSISRATAFRLVAALEESEPVERETIEGKLRWRLPTGARDHALRISTSQMVAFSFVRGALGFLRGTGIEEDLSEVFDRLSLALRESDYALFQNLDRKLFDVNEAAYDYKDKLDVVNAVITALLREERLTLVQKDGARVKIDPYTLALYKKGLYLVGFSHRRKELRTFGLDKVEDADRHAGERFEYPDAWEPSAFFRGPWGILGGAKERVVVRFDARVAPFVTRRGWHWTQAFREVDGGVEMSVEPEGIEELVSWVLGFGASAEVIEPPGVRERVAGELRRAAARYTP
jgi:predicted DNA-binding transcriptional regulator YafY